MAEVFRAKAFGAHGFEKTLAIKRILPELAKDPEFEERFIAEAKLAVELSHANVVQVLDFGRFAGTLFIAMELVNGLDLAALLKFYSSGEERVPIPAAFQISIEIIRGLSFAHQNDVVHRDISPSNILLSKAGEVKIADFGIAVAMQGEVAADEGRIMGKWRYMSPEQTKGSKLTAQSDLFSAAVVIHELFAGKKLFPGTDSKEITENIHCMPIPSLADLRPGVPPALDEVLGQALQRDIGARKMTGAEMLRSLTEASYKSSIVATSIDVSDAVAAAAAAGVEGASVKPEAAGGMDDLIRAQLAGVNQFKPAERRTAVAADVGNAVTEMQSEGTSEEGSSAPAGGEGGTMIRRGVDKAGVTIWELDRETVAAVPSAKRKLTAEMDAVDVEGKAGTLNVAGRYDEDTGARPGLRRGVILSAVGFSSVIALMIFFVGRGPTSPSPVVIPNQVSDGGAPPLPSKSPLLTIDSKPQGALVLVDGRELGQRTPVNHQVKAQTPVEIIIRLEGHEEHRETQTLEEGGRLRIVPTLKAHVASLSVNSSPEGARVLLDGEEIGVTPFISAAMQPGSGKKLQIVLKDYKTIESEVDLVHGELVSITKTLKSTLVYGFINIGVRGSWAYIYEGNKKLGDTYRKVRLRVGVHKLRLVNPESKKEKRVTVEVFADKLVTKTFDL
jgi:tRNA A-37 threonylcarbamoyl transferase component Bud32